VGEKTRRALADGSFPPYPRWPTPSRVGLGWGPVCVPGGLARFARTSESPRDRSPILLVHLFDPNRMRGRLGGESEDDQSGLGGMRRMSRLAWNLGDGPERLS